MKPEVIEYKDTAVSIFDSTQDEGYTVCTIDISGEFRMSNKAKALIVLLPQHSNETPTVINIGLTHHEIDKSIDILNHARKCSDQE